MAPRHAPPRNYAGSRSSLIRFRPRPARTQAACRTASICFSQATMWFQLPGIGDATAGFSASIARNCVKATHVAAVPNRPCRSHSPSGTASAEVGFSARSSPPSEPRAVREHVLGEIEATARTDSVSESSRLSERIIFAEYRLSVTNSTSARASPRPARPHPLNREPFGKAPGSGRPSRTPSPPRLGCLQAPLYHLAIPAS